MSMLKFRGFVKNVQILLCVSLVLEGCATGAMQAVQFEIGAEPEEVYIGEVPLPKLRDYELLIKVYATAINRADTLQRKGQYPSPAGESDILGLEAAGCIHTIGPKTSKWKVGDRVMALLSGGGNAEYVAVHEDHLLSIPTEMTMVQAAAIPEVWLTAFQLLHVVGGVRKGDTVLIHAGGSGVGTAAVQLVKLAGATSIVTAGSAGKLTVAKELGASAGFNYKEENWSEKVLQHTQGKGVDLILDCVGSSFWEKNAAAIATDGKWVLYGLLGGAHVNGDILIRLLRKRVSLLATTLRARSVEYKASVVAEFAKLALPHFVMGELKPVIDRVFPLSDIGAAHRTMEENTNTGKIILTVTKEAHDEL